LRCGEEARAACRRAPDFPPASRASAAALLISAQERSTISMGAREIADAAKSRRSLPPITSDLTFSIILLY
jgi:hypothetical protein